MTLRIDPASIAPPPPEEQARLLSRRRRLMLALNLATVFIIATVAASIAASGGWTGADIILVLCVIAITPWHAIGFWNALVGLVLLHGTRDGVARAAPFLSGSDSDAPVLVRTALLMTLRNEDPERALSRLRAVKAELDRTGFGGMFDCFVLSDTSRPDVAAAEEAAVARWRADMGGRGLFYRRRSENTGFKAGNVRDFCERWGAGYELMLPLDADSLMGAPAILRMVRIMQAHPRIGILQSLVVGLPSRSAFARLFQFGMRAGMRCYTLGATWWAGDCGPFWGHNALVRIAPFRAHCTLPDLPGPPPLGGPILSHDQVEAVLMRRAGYEVRVVPVESESYEENPPALPDFLARDARWCVGNMQYLKLLRLPGAHPMGRFQLAWAVLMFATIPALPLALLALPFAAYAAPEGVAGPAAALYLGLMVLSLFPKLAGFLDVALTPGMAARYGGAGRFALSAGIELAFSFLLSAVSAVATTVLLLRLALHAGRGGRRWEWGGQARDAHALSWGRAARDLAAPTLFALLVAGLTLALAPGLLVWILPLIAGGLLAIPLAVVTADPRLGRALERWRICALPEEQAPPAVLAALTQGKESLHRAA
ncbi:glucans biosynthesis glucosyltransferase MdoH [Aquabacter cavernae]|uniref:glucans biosynthesis glucosyltransferase MdoH n=1 Tax=Aquabacter cavernae TaxID=2496029 RepID=UPI000F8C391D|nr:glucans biosynthesis glucosyltransferase MdoH [Aquabacter cavernae]